MKTILRVWKDIRQGKNLDVFITIVISIVIAILSIVGITNQNIISSAILTTLGLVSASMLANRYKDEKIVNMLSQLENPGNLAKRFIKSGSHEIQIMEAMQNAQKVYLLGASLSVIIPLIKSKLDKDLESGVEARFLVMQPSGKALSAASFRSYRNHSVEYLNEVLTESLTHLAHLAKTAPVGKLQCKVIDFVSPYKIIAIDPHLRSGRMFVTLDTFRTSPSTRPYFELTRENDSEWFMFFWEQFENMWKAATPYEFKLINNDS